MDISNGYALMRVFFNFRHDIGNPMELICELELVYEVCSGPCIPPASYRMHLTCHRWRIESSGSDERCDGVVAGGGELSQGGAQRAQRYGVVLLQSEEPVSVRSHGGHQPPAVSWRQVRLPRHREKGDQAERRRQPTKLAFCV